MLKYKLTTQDLKTHNGFQWVVGFKVKTSGEGELCSNGWLHYYHHPFLALLFNCKHADIKNPKLWEVEAEGIHKDDLGRKGGCTEMTLLREIAVPEITFTQRLVFGILCAKEVYPDKKWNEWADSWLNGKDRSKAAADYAAAYAAAASSYAAYAASSYAAAAAAYAAAAKSLDLIKIAEAALTYK